MRVAIPTKNGRIDQQYSRATEFTVYEVEIELVKKKEIIPLGKTTVSDFLTEQDINAVICGKIRSSARNTLRAKRIELTYGVIGEADDVMIRYLSGERLGDIDENAYWRGREGLE
ncbi:NifB/NifX family molybdenum-iron cluster-binding protein [Anaerotignum sp.]|nr:NifB/NifX family molybdenum-iron cluster-binding protein [Anaerotignum sp.]MBQ7758193.1 NifB/NifX family molybdenum-iron cluster-binding protein [Anaerotignum sp.]